MHKTRDAARFRCHFFSAENYTHIGDVKKDPRTRRLQWAPVGSGFIGFRGQFKALREDGYDGTMSLETHYVRSDGNKLESTRESLMGPKKVIREAKEVQSTTSGR